MGFISSYYSSFCRLFLKEFNDYNYFQQLVAKCCLHTDLTGSSVAVKEINNRHWQNCKPLHVPFQAI